MRRRVIGGLLAAMLVIGLAPTSVLAEGPGVSVNAEEEINIPDQNFKKLINSTLKHEENAAVTEEDMAGITSLSVNAGSDVTDIEGIQYAVNLVSLNMDGAIKNIEKINNLTKLERLNIDSNDLLTDLSFLGSKPELTDLTMFKCTGLTSLKGITAGNCPKLEELSCSRCTSLSDISALADREIPTLIAADFEDCAIADLSPLEGYTSITELNLEKVEITEENRAVYKEAVSSMTGLETLYMPYCDITDEDTEMFSTLQNLKTLLLNMNELTSTDFCDKLPADMEVLGLLDNDIEDMDNLGRLTQLEILSLGGNKVTDFSFISKLTSLTDETIRHADGTEDFPSREIYSYGSQSDPIEIKDGQVTIANPYIGVNGNPVSFDGAEIASTGDSMVTVSYDAEKNEITLGNIPSSASVDSIMIQVRYNIPVSNGEYKVADLRIETYVREKSHEHSWGDVTYTWSEDGKTCTAERVCEEDSTHVESAQASVNAVITKPATCTSKGETTYTAVFDNDWAETQTKVLEDVEMIPHSYGTEWKSDENGHWHMCAACQAKTDEADHTFEWIVDKEATDAQPGSRHQECTVCGYALAAVEIPPLKDDTEDTEQTVPPQTEKPEPVPSKPAAATPRTGDVGNMLPWALLFVGAAGVGAVLHTRRKLEER
ncbi:MAG TPA: hypothetical protein H9981_00490 [Candidatus Mediterraneibacter caccavium]|uniref:Internalin-A n=1 Tax=Candidatus Mediterraneibacter caccavium TaxID=2838661 RepID=A0A9D1VUY8_9FIRM|nr:hypothetical protein [Candidatus Mediterraneibacter caccavium]